MDRLVRTLDRMLEWTLVLLMSIMVITVVWQVVTRFVLNNPSSFTEELATFLLIWISLLGAAYAYRKHAHLGIDLLVKAMSPSLRRKVLVFQHLVVALFSFLVLILGGLRLMYITLTLKQLSAALRIPMGYVYAILPLSGLLLIFYALVALREPPPEAPSRPLPVE